VLAVAALVHHDGQGAQGALGDLTTYSSHGPLRDGRDKPEIAAPAELVTSALADGYDPFGAEISNDGLWQTISGGTSAASPHVAGAIALLLEVEPDADLARIHEALARGAGVDARTGAVPNNGWGWGKLQIEDAVAGLVDEIADTDGDGFGAVAGGGIDCDDTNEAIGPRMAEAAGNGVDDDCDGQSDEPLAEGGFFERMDPPCPDEIEPDAGVDAGPPPPPDAGVDAAAPDAATGEDASPEVPRLHATGGGCGCRTAPSDGRTGGLVWLAVGLAVLGRRRGRKPAHQH
jgi:MYXO-CTERM domain-containing protein